MSASKRERERVRVRERESHLHVSLPQWLEVYIRQRNLGYFASVILEQAVQQKILGNFVFFILEQTEAINKSESCFTRSPHNNFI